MKSLSSYLLFVNLVLASSLLISCNQDTTPKPKAFLALEYPKQEYATYSSDKYDFEFDKNNIATIKEIKSTALEIHYPEMKATIFMNYKPIENNLDILLKDAQKLTYEHFVKADEIVEQPYVNSEHQVYGMFYNVQGDAATNVQFYVTDSVHNFVVASLYFYAQPNFDSILPATSYIQNDMRKMLETMKWKKK